MKKWVNVCYYLILKISLVILVSTTTLIGQGASSALQFDNLGANINIPSDPGDELNPSDAVTAECWFNPQLAFSNDHQPRLVVKHNSWVLMVLPSGQPTFSVNDGTWREGAYGSAISNTDQWYHLAGVFNGSSVGIYVNGILDGYTDFGETIQLAEQAYDVRIGGMYVPYRTLSGYMDEIRIWHEARTATQIRTFMNKKLTATDMTNLVGYWRFDEGIGATAYDLSQYNNDGSVDNDSIPGWYTSAWITSTAPIGDESVYTITGSNLNLASSDGDNVSIENIAGSPDIFSIMRIDESPNSMDVSGLNNVDPLRYWEVWFAGGTSPDYDIIYNYNGHPGIGDENDLRLGSRSSALSTEWTDASATLDTPNDELTVLNQTSGMQYILASSTPDNPLPVYLELFDVRLSNGIIELNWKTGSEFHNLGFEIWRKKKTDGNYQLLTSYRTNSKLNGLGNSSVGKMYEFTDNDIKIGENYIYQLLNVDFNGITHVCSERNIYVNGEVIFPHSIEISNNFPNPFNPKTFFDILVKDQTNITFSVFNILGIQVDQQNYKNLNGNIRISWDGSNMASGIYFYKISSVKNDKIKIIKSGRMSLIK
jgi:hypothetical protein